MSKKRLYLLISVIALAFVLTGCTTKTDLISLDTKFVDVMDDGFFAAIITFPLSQAINWLEPKVGIFLAIALVTVAINIIVLAFTFKSSVSMQRMQELQPELSRIEAKYEGRTDDVSQQRKAMEVQQLYQKNGINIMGTLVTTFIQFPLLIGMYNAVRRSYAVANAEFLGAKLSLTPSEALSNKVWVCLVIFILMVVFQFISTKVGQWIATRRGKIEAEKHHKTYKKPEQQNPMMPYMMLLMVAFAMYSCPTALSLYYCIYSVINIIKTIAIDKITHKGE